jgi:hypothetical protein
MEPHVVDGRAVAYIAHLDGEGFCLCGTNDLVLPVYLYSPNGSFDPENPSYQYFLWEITTRTRHMAKLLAEGDPVIAGLRGEMEKRALFWQELIDGRIPSVIVRNRNLRDEPQLLTLDVSACWHQGSPFNDQCPELTPGADEHAVVGCIATAMVQIMYYWKWPDVGESTGATLYHYRWRTDWDEEPLAIDPGIPDDWMAVAGFPDGRLGWVPDGGGRLRMIGYWDGSLHSFAANDDNITNKTPEYLTALQTLYDRLSHYETAVCDADFGATTYDWSILQDRHIDPPDPGDIEAAELSYHGAIACEMGFGVMGSGSNGLMLRNALIDHFRYDPDAHEIPRDMNVMTSEINWLRPIALGGGHPDGGAHEMVVCGYNKGTDPNREFLMNLGWGGCSVNWYTWDDFPFPVDPVHVFDIAPRNVVKFVGNVYHGDGSPGNPYLNIQEAIHYAPDGATLIFKAGSNNTFAATTLVIDRPFTLKGVDVTICREWVP